MSATKCKKPYLPCSIEEQRFSESKNFKDAAKVVLKDSVKHSYYHHYTQLPKLLTAIKERRWLLSKCDSVRINDLQEPRKFGDGNNILKRTYITCFGYGLGENAAMWGLYGKGKQSAVRIAIPGDTMIKWMKSIEFTDKTDVSGIEAAKKELDLQRENGNIIRRNVLSSMFRDIIYLAVSGQQDPDRYDAQRANTASWGNAIFDGRDDEAFPADATDGCYAGWVKDCEWQYEKECRLCVRLKRNMEDGRISIKLPDYVLADMRFTFGPWLSYGKESAVENRIMKALNQTGALNDSGKLKIKRFRRSTLHNALNFIGKSKG